MRLSAVEQWSDKEGAEGEVVRREAAAATGETFGRRGSRGGEVVR